MDSMDMNLSKLREIVKDRVASMLQSMGSQRVGHDLATEQHQRIVKCGYILSQDYSFLKIG